MSQRREGNWAALQQYLLQGPSLQETGVELGRGSYAVVCTVEYNGLTCAAKKLHRALYEEGMGYAAYRFQEECAILSQLRHPNIVQFMGVYHQPGSMLPALVMEYLPMTLAQCLDKYGVLPSEIGYSVLKDVALAVGYLHQHSPPVIHRDLSGNNVLLTPGMTAKISDLGVAKLLALNPELSPSQMRTMTQTPGTQCYMPPEAQVENPRYTSKVDIFSYGILMVHLFSGQWPFPTEAVKFNPQDDSRMIPQSEADRRQEKLDVIGREHPLMTLILGCLHNNPDRRPEAVEIVSQVSQVAARFPPSSENKVELLHQLTSMIADTERLQQVNRSLTAATERLQEEHEAEIRSVRESSSAELESTRQTLQAESRSAQIQRGEAERLLEESKRKLECAERCHSVIVEQLNLKLADTSETLSSKVTELESKLKAAEQQVSFKSSALSDRDDEVHKLTEELFEKRRMLIVKEQQLLEKDKRLAENAQQLKKLREKEAELGLLLESYEAEFSRLNSLIATKDRTIHGLHEQLDYQKSLTYTEKELPEGVKLKWMECKDMPVGVACAHVVVIGGIVYVGGGDSENGFVIQGFSPTEDKWSVLPHAPDPVICFGMGEFNGQLVMVGGQTREVVATGKVYAFDDSSKKWEEFIPPMPTARRSPAVFSQPSCLAVVGGRDKHNNILSDVEILLTQTSQWHKASPAPFPLSLVTATVMHNRCYLAEYYSNKLHQLCISVHQRTTGSSINPQVTTEWKELLELPYQHCALGSIDECLLAVGGEDQEEDDVTKRILVFSPITNAWKVLGDMPDPRCFCTTVLLPSDEILVIGGWEMIPLYDMPKVKNVFRAAIIY